MKINKKYHRTKKGTLKRNPRKKRRAMSKKLIDKFWHNKDKYDWRVDEYPGTKVIEAKGSAQLDELATLIEYPSIEIAKKETYDEARGRFVILETTGGYISSAKDIDTAKRKFNRHLASLIRSYRRGDYEQ